MKLKTMKSSVDKSLLDILRSYPEENLKRLKNSANNKPLAETPWVHSKLYLRRSYVSARERAQFYLDDEIQSEVPRSREIFYCSPNSRFGIDSHPIAYLARNEFVAAYELVLAFRENLNLSCADVEDYWRGDNDLHPNYTINDQKWMLMNDFIVLDLFDSRATPNTLLNFIESYRQYKDFYQSFLLSKDEINAYPKTRAIAKWAFEIGFDGILYRSARHTVDVSSHPKCIVMFRNKLKRPPESV